MKALTICQPYAALIVLPDDDDRAKRVENRTWHCGHVGALAIHAGKSKAYLSGDNYGLTDMPFGAMVGVCDMRGCFQMGVNESTRSALRSWTWLATHEHVEGPYCFVLAEVRRFKTPIPCSGKQGLWDWTPPENWKDLLA